MEQNSDDEDGNLLIYIFVIVFLIIITGIFATAELALLSANKNKLDELAKEGNLKANKVLKLKAEQDKYLLSIRIGITLTVFLISAIGVKKLVIPFATWLNDVNIPLGNVIAFAAIILLLGYFTIMFGNLLPKRITRRNPAQAAMVLARLIIIMNWILTPFRILLSASTNLVAKLTRIETVEVKDELEEDIRSLIESGVNDGSIDTDEQKMIEGIFKFDDLDADDVMTPRVDVFMIDIEDDVDDYLDNIIGGKFSRIPIYKESLDNIIGVLHVKDLLLHARKVGFDNIDIASILRKAYFVTDRTKINILYKKMQEENTHIVFLTDEFGGFRGIVTLEDIIEEIMGNIYDEYDDDVPEIVKISDDTYLIEGSTSIQYVNRELDTEFDENHPDFDTIAGLIISLINRIPEEDLEVEYENAILKVEKMDNTRIAQVLLKLISTEKDALESKGNIEDTKDTEEEANKLI